MPSRVTGLFEESSQQWRLWVQPVGHVPLGIAWHPGEMAVDVVAGGEVTGHHSCATGRTDTAGNREAMEVRSLPCQPVDVRCFDIRMAVATQVTPAPVVSKDKQNVWFLGSDSNALSRQR